MRFLIFSISLIFLLLTEAVDVDLDLNEYFPYPPENTPTPYVADVVNEPLIIFGERVTISAADVDHYIDNINDSAVMIVSNIDTLDTSERSLFRDIDKSVIINAYKSTVGIYSYYVNQNQETVNFGGTGIYISPTDVITARHVVASCICYNGRDYVDCHPGCLGDYHLKAIFINPSDTYKANEPPHPLTIEVNVADISRTTKNYGWITKDDIARLKTQKKSSSYVGLSETNCYLNDTIISVHYPTGWKETDSYKTRDGFISGSQLSKLFGRERKVITVGHLTKQSHIPTVEHDLLTWARSSGAGVISAKTGKLCGIHVGGSHYQNIVHTVSHPFLNKIGNDLKLKSEL